MVVMDTTVPGGIDPLEKSSITFPIESSRPVSRRKFDKNRSIRMEPQQGFASCTSIPEKPARQYITTGKKIKIRSMAKSGMKKKMICELEHVSPAQFEMIISDPSLEILDAQITEETRKTLGAGFLQLSDLALQQATNPEKLGKMNAFQSTIIAATAYDKFRLSENLSTQNISIQGIVAHLHNEKEELKKAREAVIESLG